MVSTHKKWGIWLAYLPVALIIFYYFITNIWTGPYFTVAYLLFLALGLLVDQFPIRHNYTYYSLTSGISVVAYGLFGLLPEMIITSIALLALLLKSDIRLDQHYRYPLNLLMANVLSIVSAGAFTGVRNAMGNPQFRGALIFPLITYLLTYIVGNQLIAFLTQKYYYNQEKVIFFDRHLSFSLWLNLLIAPFLYILIYMYGISGAVGVLMGGIPFVTVSIGLKYFYKEKNYRQILMKVNEYSRKLTSTRNIEKVINSFVYYLYELFPIQRVYYYAPAENNQLELKQIYYNDGRVRIPDFTIQLGPDSTAAESLRNNEILSFDKGKDWRKNKNTESDYHAESAIFLPLRFLSNEKCVLVMTHQHQATYDEFFVSLVKVFYMYFKIILDNAYHYTQLEVSNLTDYLTGLPNFRGFTEHFDMIIEQEEYEKLSMIILDLDHFKKINDIHGHEAGNEVLEQVSELLLGFVDEKTYIARYGGEEFVVLLKDYDSQAAFDKAEEIRVSIEETKFSAVNTISTGKATNLKLSASIGVATYPDNCLDVYELTKLADYTMYEGSKEGGRNKVTAYERY